LLRITLDGHTDICDNEPAVPYEVSDKLTPWRRVLFEKLSVAQLVKKFLPFMEPKISLLYSQDRPLDSVFFQMNPVHKIVQYFLKIRFNITLPCIPGK